MRGCTDSCPPYGLPAVCLPSSDNVVRPIPIPIPIPTLARFRVPASLLVLARTRSLPSPEIFLAREATLLRLLPLGPKPLRSRRQPSPLSFLFLVTRRSPMTTHPPAGSYRDVVANSAVPASTLVLSGASVRPSTSSSSVVVPSPVPLQGSSGSAPV